MKHLKSVLAVTAFAVAPALFAQTAILATSDCGTATFQIVPSVDSAKNATAIAADQVTSALITLPSRRVLAQPASASRALAFAAGVPDEGVVMAGVDLKPVVTGSETRTEHAKTFTYCGSKTPKADWQALAGIGFEIVPQGWNGPRPQLKAGDPMRFIAVAPGSQGFLRSVPMQLYRVGKGQIAEGTAAADGGMNFTYPEPGRYMVVATYRRADPANASATLVDVSTLTFDVK